MITLTNNQIINLYEILNNLDSKTNVPIALGFGIIHNIKILEPYYMSIMEMRERIIKESGIQSEDGHVQVPADKIEEVNKQLYSLLDIRNEVASLSLLNVEQMSEAFTELSLEVINVLYPISKLGS